MDSPSRRRNTYKSADSAADLTVVFFSLVVAIRAGTMTLRRVLSKGPGYTRATCLRDAATIVLTSFEPSCNTCKEAESSENKFF